MLGSILSYIGGMFLLMAFCAPYWISSYEESFSNFKNMGLWEYCFKDFRYPYYQFTTTFDGCHHIFSREYYVIREWLLPGWLMVVQTCVTLSFILTFGALVVLALELVRWPLKFVLQYEWILTRASLYCISASCKLSCLEGIQSHCFEFPLLLFDSGAYVLGRGDLWRKRLSPGLADVSAFQRALLGVYLGRCFVHGPWHGSHGVVDGGTACL